MAARASWRRRCFWRPPRSRSAEMAQRADPALRALRRAARRARAPDRRAAAAEGQMDAAEYEQELEKLLTELALKTGRSGSSRRKNETGARRAGARGQRVGARGGPSTEAELQEFGEPVHAEPAVRRPVHVRPAALRPRAPRSSRSAIPWSHDYPDGERHFMQILNEVTLAAAQGHRDAASSALDDPALFRYPIAYMAEPGFLDADRRRSGGVPRVPARRAASSSSTTSPRTAAAGTRSRPQMQPVIPGARCVELDGRTRSSTRSSRSTGRSTSSRRMTDDTGRSATACSKGNDPTRRLMAIVNFNNDISEYWEFSDDRLAAGLSTPTRRTSSASTTSSTG